MHCLGKILCGVVLLSLVGRGFAIAQSLDDKKARFYEMEAKAPAGYPTLFVVTSADEHPNASSAQCSMQVETLGASYSIYTNSGFSGCKTYPPNTVLFGNVHGILLGQVQVVDLVDPRDAPKLKRRQYEIDSKIPIDPAVQLRTVP